MSSLAVKSSLIYVARKKDNWQYTLPHWIRVTCLECQVTFTSRPIGFSPLVCGVVGGCGVARARACVCDQ